MDLYQYQKEAHQFSAYPPDRMGDVYPYPVMGLTEEAGEVAGKFKKILRDKEGRIGPTDELEIQKELGDVLWYMAEMCTLYGWSLEEVAQLNIQKLSSRKARGTIQGSGDSR